MSKRPSDDTELAAAMSRKKSGRVEDPTRDTSMALLLMYTEEAEKSLQKAKEIIINKLDEEIAPPGHTSVEKETESPGQNKDEVEIEKPGTSGQIEDENEKEKKLLREKMEEFIKIAPNILKEFK